MLSQLTNLKSDPLDVLLFAVGVRLSQLAKSKDEKFKNLLENRNFTIQLGSEAEQLARTYSVNNGEFSQQAGNSESPTLTIIFKDSMTGVKLLTKGDATAFMKGIQSGDLKMSGDYSLLMWFNQISKFIVPKVPEQLKPVVEQVKPMLEKAMPVAQSLFGKVLSMVNGDSSTKQSKYFNADNTKNSQDDSATDEGSTIDTLKAKATELKEDLVEKVDELKTEATEKLGTVKTDISEKLADVKTQAVDKAEEVKEQVTEKVETAKEQAAEKAETIKADVTEKVTDVMTDVKDTATEKVEEVKAQVADKVDAVKTEVKDIANQVDNKAADKKLTDKLNAEYQTKDADVKGAKGQDAQIQTAQNNGTDDKASEKFGNTSAKTGDKSDDKSSATNDHADEEVIAENVITDAVKSNDSPITNITVTRHEHDDKADSKSDAGKPAIVVQDKDGNAYKSK